MGLRSREELGARVAELRSAASVSQRELADALEVDQSALSRIENGSRGLAVAELVAVAEYFGVAIDAILRTDAPPLAKWADGDDAAVTSAVEEMQAVMEDFLMLEAGAR